VTYGREHVNALAGEQRIARQNVLKPGLIARMVRA
jgi:hypothetical protein